jgi:hypothetical protein
MPDFSKSKINERKYSTLYGWGRITAKSKDGLIWFDWDDHVGTTSYYEDGRRGESEYPTLYHIKPLIVEQDLDLSMTLKETPKEELPKMEETTFENAVVGDRVWSIVYGWGEIVSISNASFTDCPLRVAFSGAVSLAHMNYNRNGIMKGSCGQRTLFWSEVKIDAPVRPSKLNLLRDKIRGLVVKLVGHLPDDYSEGVAVYSRGHRERITYTSLNVDSAGLSTLKIDGVEEVKVTGTKSGTIRVIIFIEPSMIEVEQDHEA